MQFFAIVFLIAFQCVGISANVEGRMTAAVSEQSALSDDNLPYNFVDVDGMFGQKTKSTTTVRTIADEHLPWNLATAPPMPTANRAAGPRMRSDDDVSDDIDNEESAYGTWRVDSPTVPRSLPLACHDECGVRVPDLQMKVQGGALTVVEQYPFAAVLQIWSCDMKFVYKNCSAAIVGREYLLSAAHCIKMTLQDDSACNNYAYIDEEDDNYSHRVAPHRLTAIIGMSAIDADISPIPSQNRFGVSKFFKSKNFTSYATREDLVLLKLNRSIIYSSSAHHICLHKSFDLGPRDIAQDFMTKSSQIRPKLQVGSFSVLVLDNNTMILKNDGRLRTTTVEIASSSYCAERYPAVEGLENANATICAGSFNAGTNRGDSGAPLFVSRSGRMYAIGVSSESGRKDPDDSSFLQRASYPDAFTRIDHFCDMIANWTKNEVTCVSPAPVSDFCEAGIRRAIRLQRFRFPFLPTAAATASLTPQSPAKTLETIFAPANAKSGVKTGFQIAGDIVAAVVPSTPSGGAAFPVIQPDTATAASPLDEEVEAVNPAYQRHRKMKAQSSRARVREFENFRI